MGEVRPVRIASGDTSNLPWEAALPVPATPALPYFALLYFTEYILPVIQRW